MCALAFFAFLRIGEITASSKQSPGPLQLNQLTKLLRDSEVIGFKLTFTDYKHNYNQRPFSMVIHRQPSPRDLAISTLLFTNHTVSKLALHHLPQSRDCAMPRFVFLAVGKRMPFRNTLESPPLRQHELLFHYWHFFLANNAGLLGRERYTWAGWRDLAKADFAVFAIFLPQL